MESVCYVNEIDVRRLAVGQPVTVTLDSDPAKRLTGRVASVANVGEQRPNADSKVFEVKVTVTQSDTTLRPGMTTGNAIETLRIPEALYVPLEAINSEDGVTFAYRQSGSGVVSRTSGCGLPSASCATGIPDGGTVRIVREVITSTTTATTATMANSALIRLRLTAPTLCNR